MHETLEQPQQMTVISFVVILHIARQRRGELFRDVQQIARSCIANINGTMFKLLRQIAPHVGMRIAYLRQSRIAFAFGMWRIAPLRENMGNQALHAIPRRKRTAAIVVIAWRATVRFANQRPRNPLAIDILA